MKVTDVHIHSLGDEDPKQLLEAMDGAGVDRSVVFAPFPGEADEQHAKIDYVVSLAEAAPDRLIPFAWIEPFHDGCCEALEYAVKEKGVTGLKMIPNHWYPYSDEAMKVYEKAQELRIPILFHSGILWGHKDSSRFCRPVYFEALMHTPKVKFALAHISWPWTDECIAVLGRMRAAASREGGEMQMYIDCTPGTPDFYRSEAFDRAIKYCGIDRLMYGSDSRVATKADSLGNHIAGDTKFLSDLGVSEADMQKYFSSNFDDFMTPME